MLNDTRHVRVALVALWLVSFGIVVLSFAVLKARVFIEQDTYQAGLIAVSSAYAPYVGIIVTFYLTQRKSTRHLKANRTAALIGLVAALLFNGLILFDVIPLLFGFGVVTTALETLQSHPFGWIVAPALGYYFAADAKRAEPR